MVAMALFGGLLLEACTGPVDIESETEEVAEVEESVTRGKCENAVDEGADVWRLMCGAMRVRPVVIRQCLAESMEGRGNGKAACRAGSCVSACAALEERWALYCNERAPKNYRNICNKARADGYEVCINVCKGRSLDEIGDDATGDACHSQSVSSI